DFLLGDQADLRGTLGIEERLYSEPLLRRLLSQEPLGNQRFDLLAPYSVVRSAPASSLDRVCRETPPAPPLAAARSYSRPRMESAAPPHDRHLQTPARTAPAWRRFGPRPPVPARRNPVRVQVA